MSGPTVELTYRSAGSFLVAYATQLARGGVFVETPMPLPAGTPVKLRLAAGSGGTAAADGVTAWTRGPAGPGQGPGMQVTITSPAEALGPLVDGLASGFAGIQVLLRAAEAAPRATVGRYLRSILACEVVDLDERADTGALFDRLDLAVIDLDSTGPSGLELCARLRAHPRASSAPVLGLAGLERDRAQALHLGFDEMVANPPGFPELEAAALRCLARPKTAIS